MTLPLLNIGCIVFGLIGFIVCICKASECFNYIPVRYESARTWSYIGLFFIPFVMCALMFR